MLKIEKLNKIEFHIFLMHFLYDQKYIIIYINQLQWKTFFLLKQNISQMITTEFAYTFFIDVIPQAILFCHKIVFIPEILKLVVFYIKILLPNTQCFYISIYVMIVYLIKCNSNCKISTILLIKNKFHYFKLL